MWNMSDFNGVFTMDKDKVQKKLDELPDFFRWVIRGGAVEILCIFSLFIPDIAAVILMLIHICTVSVLIYTDLDLRTDFGQPLEEYRKSLKLEIILCSLVIIVCVVL